ncbi:hypothetical protein EI94DRAFT_1704716 [Lactarius quietus]|nr:hypothetical protein EI94DRAFT_1704716 [Lactarius quietus]
MSLQLKVSPQTAAAVTVIVKPQVGTRRVTVTVDFDPDESERTGVTSNALKRSGEEIPRSSHFPLKRSKAIIAPSTNVMAGPSVRSAITCMGSGATAPVKTSAAPLALPKAKRQSATPTGKGKQPARAVVLASDNSLTEPESLDIEFPCKK